MAAKSLHPPTAFLSSSKVIGFLASKSFAVIGVETGIETFLSLEKSLSVSKIKHSFVIKSRTKISAPRTCI